MLSIKKAITAGVAFTLSALLAVSATTATLQVMAENTTPEYGIEQIVKQWNSEHSQLVNFQQDKMLFPYVGDINQYHTSNITSHPNEAYQWHTANNVVDHYVSVQNTGNQSVYVRTLFAFEMGELTEEEFEKYIGISKNETVENNSSVWNWNGNLVDVNGQSVNHLVVEVSGKRYWVIEARHQQALNEGVSTAPSLRQVYLDKDATNEIVEKIDGDGDGKYTILASSQYIEIGSSVNFDNIDADDAATLFNKVLHPSTGNE